MVTATADRPTDPHPQSDRDRGSTDDGAASAWRDPWTVATALVAVLLTLLVLWPLVDLARTALDLVWRPSGDWAAIALRTADVGHLTPLVGPYSRFGWNHPGPLLFWSLAAPFHLMGGRPESVLAAAASLNAVTVAGISAVTWRRGRLPLVALTMGALAILFHALGPVLLRDPWNPYLTLLPLALLTLLAWSIAEGDRWMWIPTAWVASAEVQSHVGYLPMVVVVVATGLLLAWRRRRDVPLLPAGRPARRWFVGLLVATLVVCWTPVIVDQFHGTGNLSTMVGYFLSPDGRSAGLGTALHEMAGQLRFASAPWFGRPEQAGADGQLLGGPLTALLVPFAAMAASMVFARRVGARTAVRFQVVVLSLALGGLVATARVIGPVFDWIVRWWWVIACLWWLSIAFAVWSAALRLVRSRDVERGLTTAVAAVAAIVILAGVTPVVDASRRAPVPNASTSEILGNFLDPVVAALAGRGPVLVETIGSVNGEYGDAVRYALERAGIEVAVPPRLVTHFGPERSTDRRDVATTLWVVSADAIVRFRADPSMSELAGWDPLDPAARATYLAEETELAAQLRAVGREDLARALATGDGGVDSGAAGLNGVDQELLARVEAVRRRGDPVAIFVGPGRRS